MDGNAGIVQAALRHYREQDRDAAFALFAHDFVFTSPQDDHLDKALPASFR